MARSIALITPCSTPRVPRFLSAGVAEDDLPRTHRGVIAVFGQQAVQTGRIDPELASAFNRTEALRLKADYTGIEIDARAATEVVTRADQFVRAVQHAFGLEQIGRQASENRDIQERSDRAPVKPTKPLSIEELQRQGREAWLLQRQAQAEHSPGVSTEQKVQVHKKDLGLGDD